MELNQSIPSKSNNQLHLEEEDLDVPWSELLLKNKIGSGTFSFELWKDFTTACYGSY